MSEAQWTVTYRVFRQTDGATPHFDTFRIAVDPDEYVLDGVERVWALHDRSLTFRHACHHSTCGACGMRVNGGERLTCITCIRDVTTNGGTITVEPLRNFPVVSDLVVDMSTLYAGFERVGLREVAPVSDVPTPDAHTIAPAYQTEATDATSMRLIDCIECGLCVSACPIAATDPDYLGPAVLAAIQQRDLHNEPQLGELADQHEGVWRCHSAFECSTVCPACVEPAWRIMDLRRQLVGQHLRRVARPRLEEQPT